MIDVETYPKRIKWEPLSTRIIFLVEKKNVATNLKTHYIHNLLSLSEIGSLKISFKKARKINNKHHNYLQDNIGDIKCE